MRYLTFLILLLGCNGLFADIGFSYFYMRGKVFDIHNQPLKDKVIFFRDAAGEISRVKTDSEGVYRVRSNYVLPCMSGNVEGEDKRNRAFSVNSPTISVYYQSYCDELPQQWNQFYFNKKDRSKEWVIQNIHLQSGCELITERVSSKHQKYLEKRNQVAKLSQFKTPTKFTYRYDFDFIRSYYEPLGLTEREFFEGLVIEKNGIFVDTLSSEKIVISFLQESGYSDDIRKISYTYFKKNGVITEEKVKCETLKK